MDSTESKYPRSCLKWSLEPEAPLPSMLQASGNIGPKGVFSLKFVCFGQIPLPNTHISINKRIFISI